MEISPVMATSGALAQRRPVKSAAAALRAPHRARRTHHVDRKAGSVVTPRDDGRHLLFALQTELNDCVRMAQDAATPDRVHDIRVATRRLRIVVRAWRAAFHPQFYAGLRFDLKGLADVSAAAREAHIRRQIALPLLHSAKNIPARDARMLAASTGGACDQATDSLLSAMQGSAWSACLARINDALLSPHLFGISGTPSKAMLVSYFESQLARIRRALAHSQSPQALHRLRIRTKSARYLGEMLCPTTGAATLSIVAPLRSMQGVLGDLNDSMQLRAWLKDAALPDTVTERLVPKVTKLESKYLRRYEKLRKRLRRTIAKHLSQASQQRPVPAPPNHGKSATVRSGP